MTEFDKGVNDVVNEQKKKGIWEKIKSLKNKSNREVSEGDQTKETITLLYIFFFLLRHIKF